MKVSDKNQEQLYAELVSGKNESLLTASEPIDSGDWKTARECLCTSDDGIVNKYAVKDSTGKESGKYFCPIKMFFSLDGKKLPPVNVTLEQSKQLAKGVNAKIIFKNVKGFDNLNCIEVLN